MKSYPRFTIPKTKTLQGIAFPTCVNPNHIPAIWLPVNAEDRANITLHNGDVVNIMLGIQIDGFPSIVAETLVIGASKESPVTDKESRLIERCLDSI